MTITIETIEHPTQAGLTVEAVRVPDADTLRELRGSEWTDDQMSILTFPSKVVGYIGGEPPRALSGDAVNVGDVVLKGPAGDFEVVPAELIDGRA
ncbi:alcohol dehydrogenase [Microbacterium sp. HM58-2]|nr:alcohol dehydrogenase [Microbacterium sp. HM58-2]